MINTQRGRVKRQHWLARFKSLLVSAAAGAILLGCAGVDVQNYAAEKPALDLKRYFNGTLEGHGMFVDRSGVVKRRFVVAIKGRFTGSGADEVGTLEEDFVWSDGERERRVWTLKPTGPGRWTGTAADVVGVAQGEIAGNALNWKYVYALKTKEGKTYNLRFDDWMYLVDDQVLLNRAQMSFWGFGVGEVLISFRKLS